MIVSHEAASKVHINTENDLHLHFGEHPHLNNELHNDQGVIPHHVEAPTYIHDHNLQQTLEIVPEIVELEASII